MKCRVFTKPDGSLLITHWAEQSRLRGESDVELIARLHTKLPHKDLPYVDCERTELPQDRTHRHKWRMRAGRAQPDLTIPDPPHPKQALLDQIEQAASVAQLKVLMAKVVRGERA